MGGLCLCVCALRRSLMTPGLERKLVFGGKEINTLVILFSLSNWEKVWVGESTNSFRVQRSQAKFFSGKLFDDFRELLFLCSARFSFCYSIYSSTMCGEDASMLISCLILKSGFRRCSLPRSLTSSICMLTCGHVLARSNTRSRVRNEQAWEVWVLLCTATKQGRTGWVVRTRAQHTHTHTHTRVGPAWLPGITLKRRNA